MLCHSHSTSCPVLGVGRRLGRHNQPAPCHQRREPVSPGRRCQAQRIPTRIACVGPIPGSPNVAAVLFDMDGVLVNSEELSREVAVEALKAVYDLDVKASDFAAFTGMGEDNFLGGVARLYRKDQEVDVAKLKSKFFDLYLARAKGAQDSIAFPGARDLVLACRAAGLKTAVASSADRIKVDTNLKMAGFQAAEDFDAIVSADLFEKLKPAPDIFLAAAKECDAVPDACVVIEDALAGVAAARAAGMRVAAVSTSLPVTAFQEEGRVPDLLKPAIADISVEELQDLPYTFEPAAPEPVVEVAA